MSRLLTLAPVLAIGLLGPATAAEACTVCPLGSGRNADAYLWAGLLVSLVQCVGIGSLVVWVRRRNQEA